MTPSSASLSPPHICCNLHPGINLQQHRSVTTSTVISPFHSSSFQTRPQIKGFQRYLCCVVLISEERINPEGFFNCNNFSRIKDSICDLTERNLVRAFYLHCSGPERRDKVIKSNKGRRANRKLPTLAGNLQSGYISRVSYLLQKRQTIKTCCHLFYLRKPNPNYQSGVALHEAET